MAVRVMERTLAVSGHEVRVIEDCLNGRRTVWDDPFKAGRNGRVGLEQRIEVNSPLALVVLMLGTNDFQSVHQLTAAHSAQGLATLVQTIRQAPIEPGMPVPAILIVAPPPIVLPKGTIASKFEGAAQKSVGLAAALLAVATERGCEFFDAGTVTPTSLVDGVHLDADQHELLGKAIAKVVSPLLRSG
jgi:lysophospholipase L1-like esterase